MKLCRLQHNAKRWRWDMMSKNKKIGKSVPIAQTTSACSSVRTGACLRTHLIPLQSLPEERLLASQNIPLSRRIWWQGWKGRPKWRINSAKAPEFRWYNLQPNTHPVTVPLMACASTDIRMYLRWWNVTGCNYVSHLIAQRVWTPYICI
jgi:hypothetical protein